MPTRKAKDVLSSYWDGKLPVDVAAIAKAAGAAVIADSTITESGLFCFEENTPVIRYNWADASVRQRFTIAHELGHFLLAHGKSFRDTPKDYSVTNYDPNEVQANRFAAELLMPEAAVRLLVTNLEISDVDRLAEIFNVSQAAMMYRLKNLRLIQ